MRSILTLDGIIKGAKVNQEGLLPSFVKNIDFPRPLCREFLGSMFGGDGHSAILSSHNRGKLEKTEIKNKNDLLNSIDISRTKTATFIGSLTENLNWVIRLLNKCGVGLDENNQNKITLQNPKETTSSKNKRKKDNDIEASYEQVLHIPSEYFIDAERLLSEAGYTNGIFKTQITLINKRAGSQKEFDKLWINEISPSRTEVRLYPLKEGITLNAELQERFNIFINDGDFREDTIAYALEFIESIDATKLSSFIKTKYGNLWVEELISEFKIKDFEVFLNTIYVKFRQATIYEFTNRISKIDDVNFKTTRINSNIRT
jgi:hypothetical protein